MTGASYPLDRLRARHVDTSRPLDWLTRHVNPSAFLQWMLVICLALFLWPATFGGRIGLVMVAGTSMEPTYELGDAVIAWREPVEVGDIILYKVPEGVHGEGSPVIHRVVGGDGNGWITKGDNTEFADERSWWFIAIMGGIAVGMLLWPEDGNPSGSLDDGNPSGSLDDGNPPGSLEEAQPKRGRHKTKRFSRAGLA